VTPVVTRRAGRRRVGLSTHGSRRKGVETSSEEFLEWMRHRRFRCHPRKTVVGGAWLLLVAAAAAG